MNASALSDAEENADFPVSLNLALVVPGVVSLICVALELSRVIPARSPLVVLLAALLLLGGIVEIFAVPIAIWRLVQETRHRARRNLLRVLLGIVGLTPALLSYVSILWSDV